ncbi:hypothetical protein V5O48_012771 [Marasmius crinis-equi]|uniref:Uncharacterized protein n=1 Tax=Marasmius crinis-equi TaxID=585013 RepID=A0ABR3F1Y0_9AGAR
MDLLQEDVWCRFLIGLKSEEVDDFFRFEVFVVSSLTNIPIAASEISEWGDGHLLGNGQTRFTFNNPPTNIELWSSDSSESWLPQAWSVFHALGISPKDDLSQYELIVPEFRFDLSLSRSPSKTRRRRYWQRPIFLFIRPLPSTPLQSCTTSSLHYWSSDEDGQLPLSPDMCNHLGLPVTLDLRVDWRYAYSWSNDIYKTMRQYQIACGFDPNTTDFAQSLGYPAYKPIQNADSDRFEEIEGKNSIYFRPPSPPVTYRSQMPGESDDDTDLGYNDTDTESDLSDADFFHSAFFGSDAHSLSISNPDDDIDTHGHGSDDDFRDIYELFPRFNTWSFEDHDSSPPEINDLCTRLADLTLV